MNMRFYFNVCSDEGVDRDAEGIDLPSLNHAKGEAEKASREMVAELVLQRQTIDNMRFEITDEDGRVLATLPFRDAVRFD
jgi:hypothetical protein